MRFLINLTAVICAVAFILSFWIGSPWVSMGIFAGAVLVRKMMISHGLSYTDQTKSFAERMKKHASS